MSWVVRIDYKDIPFTITSGWVGGDDICIGLSVGKAEVQEALSSREDQVFEGLHYFNSIREELSLVFWAGDGGFWEWPRSDTLDEYEHKLKVIIASVYADENTRTEAQSQLEWIANERKKQAKKKAKVKYTKRRRSTFSQKRDQLILALIERDGYECAKCGEVDNLSIDHIMPLSKGGSDELDNLRLLCRKHNSAKGDSVPK